MHALNERLEQWVQQAAAEGGFEAVLIATSDGLVVASSVQEEDTISSAAAFVSLFQDAVERAEDAVGFACLDELALLDGSRRRFVIRPLPEAMFLVAQVPPRTVWRRVTNRLVRELSRALEDADAR